MQKKVINDIEKSMLELEDMEKNKINQIKIMINNTIKKLEAARMEEIKNLEEIMIEMVYAKKKVGAEINLSEMKKIR